MKELKNMKDLKNQVKDILGSSSDTIKGLGGKGRKMAADIKARVDQTRTKGTQKLSELIAEVSLKDVLDRFGNLKMPELLEKLRSSELARHSETLRHEALTFLHLPSTEDIEALTVAIDKLNKEVAALKGLKQDLKAVEDQVKTLKKASPRTPK